MMAVCMICTVQAQGGGNLVFFTFLNKALSIVSLRKCFRIYSCHSVFILVGMGVAVEVDPVHAQSLVNAPIFV